MSWTARDEALIQQTRNIMAELREAFTDLQLYTNELEEENKKYREREANG